MGRQADEKRNATKAVIKAAAAYEKARAKDPDAAKPRTDAARQKMQDAVDEWYNAHP